MSFVTRPALKGWLSQGQRYEKIENEQRKRQKYLFVMKINSYLAR
jgi:hypothetical protein